MVPGGRQSAGPLPAGEFRLLGDTVDDLLQPLVQQRPCPRQPEIGRSSCRLWVRTFPELLEANWPAAGHTGADETGSGIADVSNASRPLMMSTVAARVATMR
jgi:hypothetical protein